MPELPEVETVRRGLEPHLAGARLTRIEQRRKDLRFPFPDRFAERLTGARVLGLERRAKYLLAELDTGETLLAHLGMTGRFMVGSQTPGAFHRASDQDEKHTHLVIETDRGASIAFNDARRFGYMDLIQGDDLASHPFLRGLGLEPLGPGLTASALAGLFKGRIQPIKAALLDQRAVAGLGNIYVAEALHRARLHPDRPAGALTRPELGRLVRAIRAVLLEAIARGGSTLRDYRGAEGELGYFQHDFRVYDREGAPCGRSGCSGTISRKVHSGRSSFFCPACQI